MGADGRREAVHRPGGTQCVELDRGGGAASASRCTSLDSSCSTRLSLKSIRASSPASGPSSSFLSRVGCSSIATHACSSSTLASSSPASSKRSRRPRGRLPLHRQHVLIGQLVIQHDGVDTFVHAVLPLPRGRLALDRAIVDPRGMSRSTARLRAASVRPCAARGAIATQAPRISVSNADFADALRPFSALARRICRACIRTGRRDSGPAHRHGQVEAATQFADDVSTGSAAGLFADAPRPLRSRQPRAVVKTLHARPSRASAPGGAGLVGHAAMRRRHSGKPQSWNFSHTRSTWHSKEFSLPART